MPADPEAAAGWLRLAAERGDAAAQHDLGLLHVRGEGVAKDLTAARRWFAAAAEGGHGVAAERLTALDRGVAAAPGRD